MATEFQMPKLGLTMEEGTIVDWLVDDGATIEAGSPVLVIETDKTETEVEAVAGGVLQRTGAVGETFKCGEVIGYVLADGEPPVTAPGPSAPPAAAVVPAAAPATPPPSPAAAAPAPVGGRIVASPNARRVAGERGVDLRTVRGTGPGGRITSDDVVDVVEGRAAPLAAAAPTPAATDLAAVPAGRVMPATAAARQLAELIGIDLTLVPVEPTDGRVTRAAVARYVRDLLEQVATGARPAAQPSPAAAPAPPASTGGAAPAAQTPTEIVRMTGMRGTIAKRMYASLQEMAQLTLAMDADMDAVVADRDARKAAGAAPGFTDYVLAATARALRAHPRVNSQVTEEGIALLPDVHVGLAVALDEGLIVPVVHHADRLSLDDLSAETSRLAAAARAGTLGPDDVAGGTFSVTALGMFGVDMFTPVINAPNSAILGVGRIRDEVVLGADGNVTTAKRLTLSLTWDHRVFDGAPAAEFTKTICDLLADPSRLR